MPATRKFRTTIPETPACPLRPTLVLFCVVTIAFVFLSAAHAEPAITEQLTLYDVTGQSLRDVDALMLSASPVVFNGKKYRAFCHYVIRWRYNYDSDSDWCAIKSVAVTDDITYTMPRWADYSKAPSEAQEKWNSFYARLTEHEEGHARLSREAARDIEREIGMLKRRSCQELKEAVEETGNGLLKQLRTADEEYDARTQHGILQGAVLHF